MLLSNFITRYSRRRSLSCYSYSYVQIFCVISAFLTTPWLLAPVNAITTAKSSPITLPDNSTSPSHLSNQFVQIRSGVNQPTRAFIVQQKSALSPVQQTHILDDVQKNQRVHYHQPLHGGGGAFASPSSSSSTSIFQNANDGNGAGFSSGATTSNQHAHAFESAPVKSNEYVDLNGALSAPALQTVVLSPQQSLPTSPSFVHEYVSQASASATATATGRQQSVASVPSISSSSSSSTSSHHRIPFATASASGSAANQGGRQSSSPVDGRNFFIKNSVTTATASGGSYGGVAANAVDVQSYNDGSGPFRYTASAVPYSAIGAKPQVIGSYTLPGVRSSGEQYPKYEFAAATGTPTASASVSTSSSTTTAPKTYHRTKETSGIFSPLIEKAQQKYRLNKDANTAVLAPSSSSDKFVKEVYLKTNPEILIAKDRQKFFQQLLEGGKSAATAAAILNHDSDNDDDVVGNGDSRSHFQHASASTNAGGGGGGGGDDNDDADDSYGNDSDQTVAQNNFGNMRNQFEKEFLRQLKLSIATGKGGGGGSGDAISQVGAFLTAANSSSDGAVGAVSEFSLPNGQKVQISKDYNRLLLGDVESSGRGDQQGSSNNKIKAIVVKQLPSTATNVQKSNILEELTKGVVPPGAEFEVIKRNKDGALEEVSKLPQNIPQKKVTFVILEEQADGTVKVQGVRGSEKEALKESGEEVDTIIRKIKEGELKLPPSTRLSPKQHSSSPSSSSSSTSPSVKNHSGKHHGDQYEIKSKRKPIINNGGAGGSGSGTEEDSGGALKAHQRRKEQQHQHQRPSGGGDGDGFGFGPGSDKHFVPTPIVQTYTTPESFKSDTYATATEDATSYQSYQSSPSTFYNVDDKYAFTNYRVASTPTSSDVDVDADADVNSDSDGTAASSILNHLIGGSGGGSSPFWNRANGNSASSESSAASKTATLADNLGLFHLNSSGYIASLFSALKTHPHSSSSPAQLPSAPAVASNSILQLPFLPTTLGHRTVQQTDERDENSTLVSGDSTTSPSSAYGYGNDYEMAAKVSNANKREKDNSSGGSGNFHHKKRDRNGVRKSGAKRPPNKETRKDNDEEESNVEAETKGSDDAATASASNQNSTLSDVLKKEGFYAMARFLRQSGLDSILNDTGPFTLFIPTDKAFRTLLIQLGGPDKAEEKFKENPRLLSGLLLHHVIPGAFRVTTLQDEMTGVSLAGTQLRVNTYTTHDIEWNDITVVTVNGAKILDEKDIVIPQGIAHAIDRVMFPLPVGNLLQSLQADRENRYSNFLKILEESELSYLLTGGKTFTLFAPLNRAFTHAEFTKILADANESKSFVLRHMVPGALYSAGMKYYQVRDSMEDGQQITLYKEAGKIKVNNAHVVTRNIPATNGVIHAIDAFL